jgi:archaeosortase B (VPXXXP-CTERM-specific)
VSSEGTPGPQAPGGAPEERRPPGLGARWRAVWEVPTYRFALSFLGFLAAIGMTYPWLRLRFGPWLELASEGTAQIAHLVLGLFTDETKVNDGTAMVFFGNFPVKIIEECTGLYEALLLGAAMLAFPPSWGKIALGVLIGFPIIYALNVARIVMLLVVGRYWPAHFQFVHIYFWQVTMILIVVFAFYVWVRWVVRRDSTPAS